MTSSIRDTQRRRNSSLTYGKIKVHFDRGALLFYVIMTAWTEIRCLPESFSEVLSRRSVAELSGGEGLLPVCARMGEGDAEGVEMEALRNIRFCRIFLSLSCLFEVSVFGLIYAMRAVKWVAEDGTSQP